MTQYKSDVGPCAKELLTQARQRVLPTLRSRVESLPPQQRHWATFHFGWSDAQGNPLAGGLGGKGLRSALVYAAAEVAGGKPRRLDQAATAVELVHNFCIVHDDLIDKDRQRRGRPTVWTEFGSTAAVLTGDALLALALGCLEDGNLVGRLCEAVQELIRGEMLDVEYESRRDLTPGDYILMARLKTGALMGVACALGAAAAGGSAELVTRMDRFGHNLGLAFQIADDLLGIFGDTAIVGKPVGSDLRRRNWTYPVLATLSGSDPAAKPLRDLYSSTEPPDDDQVAECVRAIERTGARDASRKTALAALGEAEDELDGLGLDPHRTARLWAVAASVVDRSW
jgi:geranylgeranyl diphosphate synthase type I